MATIAKTYLDELPDLKKQVNDSYQYFSKNREKFNKIRKFVLKTNISQDDKANLIDLNKPLLQFNILETYMSRLMGEFSKQQPSLEVQSQPVQNPPDADMVDAVEGHIRVIFNEFDQNEIYKDQLSGGYSVMRLYYEYENPYSFNHKIYAKRVFDPLLTGFDPTAREKHKGDGNFCYELYPLTEYDLIKMYPKIKLSKYGSSSAGFKWSYQIGGQQVWMLCEMYKKKKKKIKIHLLADNRIVTDEQYEKIKIQHSNEKFAQKPAIIDTRKTVITTIRCYRFIENQMLESYDTDYSILPYIFVDGNSVFLRESNENSDVEQIVKPYVENAIDAQRLKNLSGQQLADGIETMIAHKMKVAEEGIPPQYLSQYTDIQYAGNYIYRMYDDQNRPINPPQEVVKVPLPPEIMGTFNQTDQLAQTILGSYDASLGINNNQLSGVAIVEGATQSNAAAMPYIVNLLVSLQQLANGILDLIPKLYVTPRSIPIITPENKRAFILINTNNVPSDGKKYKNTKPLRICYNSEELKVIVKPGVNFQVQQQRALDTTLNLAKTLPSFASILNGKGLPILFENLNIRGADRWRVLAEEQVEMQQQMQQMQQQNQSPQFNPAIQKIALEQQKMVLTNQEKQAEIQLKQQELMNERLKMDINAKVANQDNIVQLIKANTEEKVHKDNTAIKMHDQLHQHQSDMLDHAKDILNMANMSKPVDFDENEIQE